MIDGLRSRAKDRPAPRPGSIGTRLAARGVSADAITLLGIVLAGATGALIAFGYLYVAVAMLIVGGLMDTLDGVVAKAAGTSSIRGAFFDSVSDRLADGLIFGGLCWYFIRGSDPRLALLPVAILVVSSIVSYERAKAESLGFVARGGLMERAERLILLGVALFFHVVLVPLLAVLLGLTGLTAIGRFVRVWRQAARPVATVAPARAMRNARVESRWRTWRETGHTVGSTRRSRSGSRDEPLSTRLRQVLANDRVRTERRPPRTRRHVVALHRRLNDDR